ncbi:cell division and transport-associated protein TolQ [Aquabacter spiritensis]|uniref:Tol-Pal system protein TolQ n=2 Tax=Aquabacter spiritensis TaxID=933073 RepID=A0A4R3LYL6_9HYPH|nr:cell division and transport-associated protein TolQ [Aquabacter spiritensis]
MTSDRTGLMTLTKLFSLVALLLALTAPPALAQSAPNAPRAAPTAPVTATPGAQAPAAVPASPSPGFAGDPAAPEAQANVTLLGLFLQASLIVKLIMIGLVVASVWVWAIIIDKVLLFGRTKREMDRFEQVFWSGQSLEDLYRSLAGRPNQAMAAIFVAAMREWKRTYETGTRSLGGLNQRIEKVMDVTIAREVERLEGKLLVLATVGSAGPFIGLLGTVIGIMTAFQSIAASKNTSLAVVAPGIAEALLATAIGLIAAIPATIFYNKFITQVGRQAQRLEGFADEFSAILSRQIDERS